MAKETEVWQLGHMTGVHTGLQVVKHKELDTNVHYVFTYVEGPTGVRETYVPRSVVNNQNDLKVSTK